MSTKQNEAQHAPTPGQWEVLHDDHARGPYLSEVEGVEDPTNPSRLSDLEKIARALNSRAALVEALERALIFTMSMRSIFADSNFTDRYDDAGRCENMIKTINTALAAAKGTK